jgi:hypothetical protein
VDGLQIRASGVVPLWMPCRKPDPSIPRGTPELLKDEK